MPQTVTVYTTEEVAQLRQDYEAQVSQLKADKKMLEEKISSLSRLAKPLMTELFPGSLQSSEEETGVGTKIVLKKRGRKIPGEHSISPQNAKSSVSCFFTLQVVTASQLERRRTPLRKLLLWLRRPREFSGRGAVQ